MIGQTRVAGGLRQACSGEGISRQVWTLAAGMLINSVGYYVAYPFLTIYLSSVQGVSLGSIGLAIMLSSMAGGVAQFAGGLACDRWGRKIVLCFGVLLQSAALGLVSVAIWKRLDFPVFMLLITLVEMFGGFYRSVPFVMVSDVSAPDRQTRAFSLIQTAGNAGTAAGPLIGGIVAEWSYAALFAITAAACFTYFVLALAFLRETAIEGVSLKRARPAAALKNRGFILFCLLSGALSLVYGQLLTTFSSYLYGIVALPVPEVGLLFSIYGVLLVVLQYPLAGVISRIGEARTLAVASLLFAAGFGSAGVLAGFWPLTASVALIAIAMALYMPASVTVVVQMAHESDRGSYVSVSRVIGRSGYAFGPAIGGFLIDCFMGGAWVLMAGLAAICAAGFLTLDAAGRKPRR